MALNCKDCDRTFTTKGALDQHLRDSPAHAATFDCDKCDRAFDTDQALQQHLRDSTSISQSFELQPSLHDEVLESLRAYDLVFDFFTADDPHGTLNEHDTSIMGRLLAPTGLALQPGGQASKLPSRYDNTLRNDTMPVSTFSAENLVVPLADLSWTTHMQK